MLSTKEKMKSVQALWDKTADSQKKDTAMTHYRAAEKAHASGFDGECNRKLDVVRHMLG